MEQKIKRSMRVMGCALVATALALSMVPATQAHAATKKPAQVKSVKVSQVKTTSAKVTWKKSPTKKVKGYQVKIYKGKKTYKTYTVKGRSTTSKTATGLKANTTYTTKVRAYTTKRSKKKTVKVYGKYSSAKKFTTKKTAKKPSNPSSNSNNNTNSKPSSEHKHAYTVYHPAVWKTETVATKYAKEIDPALGGKPVTQQGYTKEILVRGAYYSCSCGKIQDHEHSSMCYNGEISYSPVERTYFVCLCGERFKTAAELSAHKDEIPNNEFSNHCSSYKEGKWTELDGFTTEITYEACSICGEVKGE